MVAFHDALSDPIVTSTVLTLVNCCIAVSDAAADAATPCDHLLKVIAAVPRRKKL